MKRKYIKMCDKCFNITKKEIDVPWEKDIEPIDDKGNIVYHQTIFNCDHCPCESVKIDIEEGIEEVVSILNKKGYKTIMSCAGHDEDDSRPFIIFDKNVKLKSIPNHSFINESNNKIYFDKDILSLEESRKELLKWSRLLDYNGLYYKESVYNFIKFILSNNDYIELLYNCDSSELTGYKEFLEPLKDLNCELVEDKHIINYFDSMDLHPRFKGFIEKDNDWYYLYMNYKPIVVIRIKNK